jgi:hypothetical protein
MFRAAYSLCRSPHIVAIIGFGLRLIPQPMVPICLSNTSSIRTTTATPEKHKITFPQNPPARTPPLVFSPTPTTPVPFDAYFHLHSQSGYAFPFFPRPRPQYIFFRFPSLMYLTLQIKLFNKAFFASPPALFFQYLIQIHAHSFCPCCAQRPHASWG